MTSSNNDLDRILQAPWQRDQMAWFQGKTLYFCHRESLSSKQLEDTLVALSASGYVVQTKVSGDLRLLSVLEQIVAKPNKSWGFYAVFFLLTGITLSISGGDLVGKSIFEDWLNIVYGLPYFLSLIFILGLHEAGHYFTARRYKLPSTPPLFIPFYGNMIGTFGAFIRMKGQIINRKALLEIGLNGPVWGFVATLLIFIAGFLTLPSEPEAIAFINTIHPYPMPEGSAGGLILGENLLTKLMFYLFDVDYIPMSEIYHFPLLFAGWIGTLVTAINLLPVGQLDGGHLFYGLFRKRAKLAGQITVVLMLLLGYFFFSGWLMWVLLIILVIRVGHPPTMDDETSIERKHWVLGLASMVIFVLCFVPAPFIF
jgi:membrane-associated protease RseP (regulator of RpoE activity)